MKLACILLLISIFAEIIWTSTKPSSGFPIKRDSNQSPQLQRLARIFENLLEESLDMILFNKRITKVLIRLRGCSGWSAPVLFANPRRQVFSRRGPYYPVSKLIF